MLQISVVIGHPSHRGIVGIIIAVPWPVRSFHLRGRNRVISVEVSVDLIVFPTISTTLIVVEVDSSEALHNMVVVLVAVAVTHDKKRGKVLVAFVFLVLS